MEKNDKILGLDIGGSGIKGAIINTATGNLESQRYRIPTPQPATPTSIANEVHHLVEHFNWQGPVGVSFPTIVIDGKCHSSGNISPEWVGTQIDELFSNRCHGLPFYVGNDADLAGLAEITLGAGKNKKGKVVVITIGTGLGSGVFQDGRLVPNIELGRILHTDGKYIELFAADSARKREDLTLNEWAERFDIFLQHVIMIVSPNYFILGGGLSKKFERFRPYLSIKTPIEVAHFENNAGIVGAAMFANQQLESTMNP